MKTLLYEDVNLETKYTYSIYRFECSLGRTYLVYECNPDGEMHCIKEFNSYDDAKKFVRKRGNL